MYSFTPFNDLLHSISADTDIDKIISWGLNRNATIIVYYTSHLLALDNTMFRKQEST